MGQRRGCGRPFLFGEMAGEGEGAGLVDRESLFRVEGVDDVRRNDPEEGKGLCRVEDTIAGGEDGGAGNPSEEAEGGGMKPTVSCEETPRWHDRGYMPHFHVSGSLQSITFRLADSLPREKLLQLDQELALMTPSAKDLARRQKIDQWLDAGMGCCALAHPRMASTMQETLLRFHGDRYELIAWCIMPNHVHVLIEARDALWKIVQSWKSFTGRWAMAHAAELGLDGLRKGFERSEGGVSGKRFWMREYWDRCIRDEKHFRNVVHYIHNNPVKAGLCSRAEEWPWSSGHEKRTAPSKPLPGIR